MEGPGREDRSEAVGKGKPASLRGAVGKERTQEQGAPDPTQRRSM